MAEKSIHITLRIDPVTFSCLQKIQAEHGWSRSKTIREILAAGMCHYCPYTDCPRKEILAKEDCDLYKKILFDDYEIEIKIRRKHRTQQLSGGDSL